MCDGNHAIVGMTKASSPPTLFRSQSVIAKSIFSFSCAARDSHETRVDARTATSTASRRADAIFIMLKFGNVRKRTLSQHENSVQLRDFFDGVFGHARAAVTDQRRDLRRAVLDAVHRAAQADPDDVVRGQPARSLEIEKETSHRLLSRRRVASMA